MSRPIIYGPAGSTYVRSARLAFEEKPAEYELVEVPFGAHKEAPHLARHPFGKVPTLDHDGFRLYETQAIIRYIDQIFPGPALQPSEASQAARMNQIIGIVDSYAWPSIAFGILFPRFVAPRLGLPVDEAAIAAALPRAGLCLQEIERLMGENVYLAGDRVSLADLMVAPLLDYLPLAPEGPALLEPHARLRAWMERIRERESMARTKPKR